MISEENLFNLLQLLDENTYGHYSTFKNQIAVNTPFINALTELNHNVSFNEIANNLSKSKISLYYTSGDEFAAEWKKTVEINLFGSVYLFELVAIQFNCLNLSGDIILSPTLTSKLILPCLISDFI